MTMHSNETKLSANFWTLFACYGHVCLLFIYNLPYKWMDFTNLQDDETAVTGRASRGRPSTDPVFAFEDLPVQHWILGQVACVCVYVCVFVS